MLVRDKNKTRSPHPNCQGTWYPAAHPFCTNGRKGWANQRRLKGSRVAQPPLQNPSYTVPPARVPTIGGGTFGTTSPLNLAIAVLASRTSFSKSRIVREPISFDVAGCLLHARSFASHSCWRERF